MPQQLLSKGKRWNRETELELELGMTWSGTGLSWRVKVTMTVGCENYHCYFCC